MQEHNLYLLFVKSLNKLNCDYVITGSIASVIYGVPRLTHDVDVVIELNESQIDFILKEFHEPIFYIPPKEILIVEKNRTHRGHFNIIHNNSGFKADIYFAGNDRLSKWALENFNEYEIETEKIRVAPPEYVIVKKLQYFQEGNIQKHLIDIEGILQYSKEMINFGYLQELITKYQVEEEWNLIQI